ncbi:MAG: hypothetical protein AAF478_05050 [Pseudomonadota bacterium]
MLLKRTISQLDIGNTSPERAQELGQLGYIQWLGALPAEVGYEKEAKRAYTFAKPFTATSPAVKVFCDLLLASIRSPIEPLPLSIPVCKRRGGAKARRTSW